MIELVARRLRSRFRSLKMEERYGAMAEIQIMIVEDEKIVSKDIQGMLERIGYTVPAVVSSGEEAVQKAAEMKPNLVLMDIMLKGRMDGVEAAEQIRAQFQIPVIYLTAYADERTLHRAKITEPYGYILKPFQEKELHTTIEIALYKHGMERKLRESEQWLSTTLRSIGDAVITTDAEGYITFMNPIAQSLTGWKQEEAISKPLADVFKIIGEKTGETVENPVARVIEEGNVVGLGNHTLLVTKDGAKVPIDDSCAPIKDDSDDLIGVVLVFRDITERKRMEEELLKVQKIESMGVLAGGIAHDFNNILTAIIGNLSLARLYNDSDKVSERLKESERAALQATDLTQQLLNFARGGVPVKETASIAELLEQTTIFTLRGSNVRCEFSIPDDLWTLDIDEGQIGRVINNLIINADQAMPEGGIVRVHAKNVVVEKSDNLPLKDGKYVKILIQDQGLGISKDHLQRIFDPYFTTKHKGSGLGLANSYSIIRKHDGYISVESEVGVGTIFCIYLLASSGEAPIGMGKQADKPIMGKGRILMMDDEEYIRELAGEMLCNIGYEVTTVTDGTEVIELYKEARGSEYPYDAVIMDLTVPGGMGAKKAIMSLVEIDPEVRVIASSGYPNDPVMANFSQYGFSNTIAKPYRIEALSEVLCKVMAGQSEAHAISLSSD